MHHVETPEVLKMSCKCRITSQTAAGLGDRKYSLIKTEELPHLPDSTFKPEVVHDVAENILSFLRANATKTGHTYWLFKGESWRQAAQTGLVRLMDTLL